jgi:hypothetical protein
MPAHHEARSYASKSELAIEFETLRGVAVFQISRPGLALSRSRFTGTTEKNMCPHLHIRL